MTLVSKLLNCLFFIFIFLLWNRLSQIESNQAITNVTNKYLNSSKDRNGIPTTSKQRTMKLKLSRFCQLSRSIIIRSCMTDIK